MVNLYDLVRKKDNTTEYKFPSNFILFFQYSNWNLKMFKSRHYTHSGYVDSFLCLYSFSLIFFLKSMCSLYQHIVYEAYYFRN